MLLGILIFSLPLLVVVAEVKDGYKGYKTFALSPDTDQQMEYLIKMNGIIESYGLAEEIEFWTEPNKAILKQKGHVILMVSPEKQNDVLQALEQQKISFNVAIPDLAKAIEEESKMSPDDQKAAANGQMTWTAYHQYATIESFVQGLARDHPDLVSISVIGQTYEGRNLYLLKIGKPRPDGKIKPAIWSDSHIHAREWISSATTTYMFNKLVTGYSTNSTCRKMLDEIDWYYLPVINPDGVEHTHLSSNTRLWRRSRRVNPFSDCIGADPNRNYDYYWMNAGANQNPCSDLYAGSYPYSEVEDIAMTDAYLEHKDQIKVLLSFHSAAQMWLTPWGYAYEYPEDIDDLVEMGNRAVAALYSQYGTRYDVGSASDLLSPGAGATDDWGKGKGGAKYSYTVELRDRTNSFLLPPKFIIPSGIETFEALVVVAQIVSQEFGPTLN